MPTLARDGCGPPSRERVVRATLGGVNHSIRFAHPEDVLITTSGTASLSGLDTVVAELLDDPRYRPGLALLFDHSRLDWSGLLPEDLVRRLHIALKEADLIGPSRIAVVSADARIREARELRTDEPLWQSFPDVRAARHWLQTAGVVADL